MRNLLDFLRKYHHWFIFILLEVASGVLLFQYNSYQGSVWLSSANAMVGKIYQWESEVTSFFSMSKANKELALRNIYLERQVDQLRRLYTDLTYASWGQMIPRWFTDKVAISNHAESGLSARTFIAGNRLEKGNRCLL